MSRHQVEHMEGRLERLACFERCLREGHGQEELPKIERRLQSPRLSPTERLELLYCKGEVLLAQKKPEEALPVLEEAFSCKPSDERGSRILEGKLRAAIGICHYRLASFEPSCEQLCVAYELLRETAENHQIARIQKILGLCLSKRGELKEARAFLEDSISSFRRIGALGETGKVMSDLAHLCFISSKWETAVELMTDAQGIALEMRDYRVLSVVFNNLGTLQFFLGHHKHAIRLLRKCIKLKYQLGLSSDIARTKLLLGAVHTVRRNFPTAREHLDQGLAIATEKGMKREVSIGHEYLGELAYEQGDFERAAECYERAREIAEAIAPGGDLINELYRRIGDLKIRTGDLKGAWKATERAIAVSESLGDRYEGSLTKRVRARIMKERRKRAEALSLYGDCIRALTELGAKFELARTHLEVGALYIVSRQEEDDLRRAAHHLNTAMDLFDALEINYYRGRTAVEMARLFAVQADGRRASERLAFAAGLSAGTGDEREIRFRIREVHTTLEEALVDRVMEERRAEDATAPTAGAPLDVPCTQGGLAQILFPLTRRLEASRCFVARRDGARGEFQIALAKGLDAADARRLLLHFRTVDRRIFSEKRPFLSIDLPTDRRFESIRSALLFGGRSMLAVPFGVEKDVEGVLYIDRESVRLDEPFLYDELKALCGQADSLAFFVAAMERDELRRDNRTLRQQVDRQAGFDNIITQDAQMLRVFDKIVRVRDSDIPVMLIGETGTGKELVAKALHYTSARKNQHYMAVNCAALPDNLLESELFGHRKGSFTGATVDKKGLFEVCNGGTFFLDEIGDMGLPTQVKLLRVLENGEIKRIGDTAVRTVAVRIISATNRNLLAEVEAGRFRADLFYRLNGIRLQIPPLRERRADIPILISHFIERYAAEAEKEIRGVRPDALNLLVSHDWPGNVRELLNEIRRAVALAEDGEAIEPFLLSEQIRRRADGDGNGDGAPSATGSTLPELMASFERQRVFMALKDARWIKTRAARNLGIHEATLRGKMKRYGLEAPEAAE